MPQKITVRLVTAAEHEVEVADDFDFNDQEALNDLIQEVAQRETDDISDLQTTITFEDGETIDV